MPAGAGDRLPERAKNGGGWDSNPRVTLTATAGFQDRCGFREPETVEPHLPQHPGLLLGSERTPVRRRVTFPLSPALPAVTPRRRESTQH